MNAEEANGPLIFHLERLVAGESDEPVTMEYIGELAVHAIRLREIAGWLISDARKIQDRLDDLAEKIDDRGGMAVGNAK
jgi:hypothetical protein